MVCMYGLPNVFRHLRGVLRRAEGGGEGEGEGVVVVSRVRRRE
jgi:hypothetical protein